MAHRPHSARSATSKSGAAAPAAAARVHSKIVELKKALCDLRTKGRGESIFKKEGAGIALLTAGSVDRVALEPVNRLMAAINAGNVHLTALEVRRYLDAFNRFAGQDRPEGLIHTCLLAAFYPAAGQPGPLAIETLMAQPEAAIQDLERLQEEQQSLLRELGTLRELLDRSREQVVERDQQLAEAAQTLAKEREANALATQRMQEGHELAVRRSVLEAQEAERARYDDLLRQREAAEADRQKDLLREVGKVNTAAFTGATRLAEVAARRDSAALPAAARPAGREPRESAAGAGRKDSTLRDSLAGNDELKRRFGISLQRVLAAIYPEPASLTYNAAIMGLLDLVVADTEQDRQVHAARVLSALLPEGVVERLQLATLATTRSQELATPEGRESVWQIIERELTPLPGVAAMPKHQVGIQVSSVLFLLGAGEEERLAGAQVKFTKISTGQEEIVPVNKEELQMHNFVCSILCRGGMTTELINGVVDPFRSEIFSTSTRAFRAFMSDPLRTAINGTLKFFLDETIKGNKKASKAQHRPAVGPARGTLRPVREDGAPPSTATHPQRLLPPPRAPRPGDDANGAAAALAAPDRPAASGATGAAFQ